MVTLRVKDVNDNWVNTENIGTKAYVNYKTREVEAILDNIIAIQNSLIGGESE